MQQIDMFANEYLQPGQECDPYLIYERSYGQASVKYQHFNFAEGIAEIGDEEMAKITELFREANRTQCRCDFASAAEALNQAVQAYWKRQAEAVARKNHQIED